VVPAPYDPEVRGPKVTNAAGAEDPNPKRAIPATANDNFLIFLNMLITLTPFRLMADN
jgi:hypothetical protein